MTTAECGGRNAIVAGGLTLLAACAPAVPDQNLFTLSWGKLGMGYEAFVNERNDCVMAASVVTENAAGRERAMPAVSASRFKGCMRARLGGGGRRLQRAAWLRRPHRPVKA